MSIVTTFGKDAASPKKLKTLPVFHRESGPKTRAAVSRVGWNP
jgi:hypothetical protein